MVYTVEQVILSVCCVFFAYKDYLYCTVHVYSTCSKACFESNNIDGSTMLLSYKVSILPGGYWTIFLSYLKLLNSAL